MTIVLLFLTGISIVIIYNTINSGKRTLLKELCENQSEIIKSIYKETMDTKAVLDVLYKQKEITKGLGNTGEYTIGYAKNDSIYFLLRMRSDIRPNLNPISLKSDLAIPLQYALSKNTGFIKGLDYSGIEVLAYCIYIPELKWGIVTKMNITEVNMPFYKASVFTLLISIILILVATIIFRRASRTINKKIENSEENYWRLFEYSAIPIWKEDYSEIKKHFDQLRSSGVKDFRDYFETHNDEISHLASLIKVVDINQKSVEFFEAESKERVIKNMLFYFNEESLKVFREELIVLAEGGKRFECEMPIRTLSGDIKTLDMHLSVVKGYEDTLSNVLVSFIDITDRKKNEEKLIRSREEWIETFDLIPDMITILDKKNKILRANKAATEKLGTSKKNILGSHCFQCVHGKQESPSFCPHAMMLKDGKEHMADFYEEKLGMDMLVSVTPIYDKDGNITGSVHIARDITEHKKKEKELNKLNRTLDALSRSSQEMTRAKNELLFLNEVCNIIINYCGYMMVWIGYAEDDEEKNVKPVAFSGFEEGYLETLNITWADTERGNGPTGRAIRTGEMAICKNMLTDPAFEPWRIDAIKRGYASSIVFPLMNNSKTFGAITIYSKEPDSFTDDEIELLSELADDLAYGITSIRSRIAQSEAEEALKSKNAELIELNATKDKFFNIIAHDMKNPFISLIGASELLYENAPKYDSEKVSKFAKILYDSAKSGFDMLVNLLEWARSQSGSMVFDPETINLKELIKKVLSNCIDYACSKKVNLNFDIAGNVKVYADKNMLETVLRNLVNNALKFTPKGGDVTVSTKNENGGVVISVKDTGIGIKKSDFDKLFRTDIKFSNPGTEHEGGTGLGLLLCKEFVEKHGGAIWVESEVDKGSTFYFNLKNSEN
jgi:PAS domain S-box-containing protein